MLELLRGMKFVRVTSKNIRNFLVQLMRSGTGVFYGEERLDVRRETIRLNVSSKQLRNN